MWLLPRLGASFASLLLVGSSILECVSTASFNGGGASTFRRNSMIGPSMVRRNNHEKAASNHMSMSSQIEGRTSGPASSELGAWVPIGSRTGLEGLCPTRVRVMGLDLVVWDDRSGGAERWSVMHDACSHKHAPLSLGRVKRDSAGPDCVECPYHGWRFGTDGGLDEIPQIEPSTGPSAALVEKASVRAYPVHVTGDLIWAFLPSSVHGESFPPDMLPEDYYHNGLMRDVESSVHFATMELPASWDFFMENGMDPSHFSFAHHGVIGRREDAKPLKIDVLPSNFTQYERKGEHRTRIWGIQRPFNLYSLELDQCTDNWGPGVCAFFVPIEEGRVRFISTLGNNKLSRLTLPDWVTHLLTIKLTEGDSIMHDTELAARSVSRDSEEYITPTSADKGVLAFRSWWRKYGLSNAPPHTFGPSSAENLRPIPRSEYTSPWHVHTKTCGICRGALRRAKRLRWWSAVMGLAAALAASVQRRMAVSLLAASLGLALSSVGNRIVLELEGGPGPSDVSDHSVPMD